MKKYFKFTSPSAKSIKRNVLNIIFAYSCLTIYGGAVNLGVFDIFPAIPFLIIAFFIAFSRKEKTLPIVFMVIVLISIPLYFAKKKQTQLFYPVLNEKLVNVEQICVTVYADFSLISKLNGECSHKGLGQALDSYVIEKGHEFIINKIKVSHADFGEKYKMITSHKDRKVYYSFRDKNLFQKENGDKLKESDLRRAVFYYPSLTMYGPLLLLQVL